MGKHKRKRRDQEIEERLRELEKRWEERHRRKSDEYEARSSRSRSRSQASHERRSYTPGHSGSTSRSTTPVLNLPIDHAQEVIDNEASASTLPSNIEQLLGEEGVQSSSSPIELHCSITKRWNAILSDGLNTETRQNIVKKYSTPVNCNLLIPPILNDEVAAALNESGIKRDQRIREYQVALAAAISSIGKVLNNLIACEGREADIETLSDSARLLCDIYHDNSITRRSLILPGLNKDMKDLMQQTPISEYLFGDKLQDKVNAIKAVKKSGQELKNTPSKPIKSKILNYRGPRRQQMPRPSGQKTKMKRPSYHVKPAARARHSPRRHHHHRRGQNRR